MTAFGHRTTITTVLATTVAIAALVALTLTGTDPGPEPLPAQATAGLHPTWRSAASALIVGAALLDLALVGGLVRRLVSTLTP